MAFGRRHWFGRRNKNDEPLQYNSVDDLLAILAEERRKSLRKRRNIKIVLAFYAAFAVLVLIIGITTDFRNFGSFGGMFSGISGMVASMYAATQTQRKGVKALEQEQLDLRATPRLIEMLEYNDKELRISAASLLQTLLPRLQASDAPMLAPEHHAILNRALGNKMGRNTFWNEELQIATLNALRQVGDASSLPIVQELSNEKTGRSPQVQQAAFECLPFLQERIEHLRQTQTLLRASDGNMTPTNVLLRPAFDLPTTQPDELLRAAPMEPPFLPVTVPVTVQPMNQTTHKAEEQTLRIS